MSNVIRGGQIQWISSLRGLLVLLVFISHLELSFISKDLLFVIGRIGVVGFFLISGYLALASVQKRTTKEFYFNRFLRIYPMFWILLLITYFLSEEYSFVDFFFNMTLFEEFARYPKMIGSSWMLPIMVLFFAFLPLVKHSYKRIEFSWWLICFGCLLIAVLRFITNKPFPTALCLLMCVGLLGYMNKQGDRRKLVAKIINFEILLIVCSYLSYGDRVVFYFIAYNFGFVTYYVFKHWNVSIRAFDILGEQGFTFFLGACIPITACTKLFPSIANWEWYYYVPLQFVSTFIFSYFLTKFCEKPMLKLGKEIEKKI